MKVLIVCAFILAVCGVGVLSEDRIEELHKIAPSCFKEHGITREQFLQMKELKINAEDVNENARCVMHCIMSKANLLTEEGKYLPEEYKAAVAPHLYPSFDDAFIKCNELSGANPCETTFKITVCLWEDKLRYLASKS